jgi:FdhD protein
VVVEEPLEIRLSSPGRRSERVWVTMRTPGHDFELAVGYLHHEGIVAAGDVARVAYCTDEDLTPEESFNVVTVTTTRTTEVPHRHDRRATGSSACGVCGKDTLAAALEVRAGARWTGPLLDVDAIRGLPALVQAQQPVFDRTGGVHAAGLATAAGGLDLVREDVGRHNAVDKVVGAALLSGRGSAAPALVVTSRAGFEIVQKAVASGIGAVVAVGAPTNLAVDLAQTGGVQVWGFVRGERAVRYC